MREIIILNNIKTANGDNDFRYVFWLSVPTYLQVASTVVSQVPGITTAEQTALNNGSVREVAGEKQYPAAWTASQIGADLVTSFNTAQTNLNNVAPTKNYTGTYYDSVTGWQNVPA